MITRYSPSIIGKYVDDGLVGMKEDPLGDYVQYSAWKAEYDIVARIWEMLGNPTYEELNGRSIYDLIKELQEAAK